MKKGSLKVFLNLFLVVFALFFLIKMFYPIIQSFLESSTKTTAYEKFQLLEEGINELISINKQTVTNRIVFELDPNFAVLAFQPNKDFTNCDDKTIKKPDACNKEACLCLFKIKKDEYKEIDCAKYEKATIFSKLYDEDDPERYIDCNYKKQTSTIIKTELIGDEEFNYKDTSFLGSYKEDIFGTITLIIEVKTNTNNEKDIYIDKYSESNLLRTKYTNTCPTDSDKICAGENYDSIIKQIIEEEGEQKEKLFSCKFNLQENKCIAENIELCDIGLINEKCACGDFSYEFGFCIKENNLLTHKKKNLPNNYCYQIDTCDKYKTDNKYESDKYACTFNICNADEFGCYWDTTAINECLTCTKTCECTIYDETWIVEANPCACNC
ncbi:MAG: hypothetical protein KKF89_05265 [Nanoarchaeota archaeon]|nr:hypothetical protein [Nanoarchaeota archaeon]MBU1855104.1 hypothetical protein [Nanoarchaeota archaeon]